MSPRSCRIPRLVGFCLLALLAAGAGTAEAKRYSADRYDSRVQVLTDGSIRVTETAVFRFESGTFREVFRELPTRRTDGIEVERVAMDGLTLPEGTGPGHAQIRPGRRVRVTWHFHPVSDATHVFELTYLVRGALRQADEADVLVWPVLPTRHRYRIAASATDILLPAVPIAEPALQRQKVGDAVTRIDGTRVRVDASGIRSDGRLAVTVRLPAGSVLAAAPGWQQRERDLADRAPQWIAAGGVALALSLIALFAIRQNYDTPKPDVTVAAPGPALPDSLAPAEAAALVTNGAIRTQHALATLYWLAERGEVSIVEEPRRLGQRRYRVSRRASRRPMAPYEEALVETIFTDKGRTDDDVSLEKARSRLYTRFKRFRAPLENELRAQGLLDTDRARVRRRLSTLAAVLLIGASLVAVPLGLLFEDGHGLWPLFIPLGLALGGFVALVAHAAMTPLSNEGLRRARYWRGFRDHLRAVATHEATPPADGLDRLLPYAVSLGLAGRWSKFMKDQRIPAPAWFHAATADDAHAGFIAFVAYTGAVTSGTGGAGAGAAAGGGASGAR